ncbi:MAG: glycosyltransferase [Deltaproteobacteria bacterium]|nr:glycosyltransferase [Deltaproteobacteria bacterium]
MEGEIPIAGLEAGPQLSGAASGSSFSALSEEGLDSYLEVLDIGLGTAEERVRPEVVHVDHLWLGAAMARSIFPEVPVVASCHAEELQVARENPELLRRVITPVRELDRVLVATPELARQAGRVFGVRSDRLVVMGQGIDTGLFRPSDVSATTAFKRAVTRHALSVAVRPELRLALVAAPEASGKRAVYAAFGEVMSRREGVAGIAICRGGDEQRATCQQRVAQVPGLQLISGRSRAVVADVLRGCHVAVVLGPQAHILALEALACGCRVVMPDLPGLEDWPKPGLVDVDALTRVSGLSLASRSASAAEDEGLGGEERLVAHVTRSLEEQLDRARQHGIDRTAVRVVSRSGWGSVFTGVERVYATLVGKRGA